MKIRLPILIAAAAFMSALFGCNSATLSNTSPRDIVGIFKYTGATYMPFHKDPPYKYAIYDINDVFVAYVDTADIVSPQMSGYMDKLVQVRGPVMQVDGDNVLRAISIRRLR